MKLKGPGGKGLPGGSIWGWVRIQNESFVAQIRENRYATFLWISRGATVQVATRAGLLEPFELACTWLY